MPRTERRVAVTGIGMVTPIGNDLAKPDASNNSTYLVIDVNDKSEE